MKHKFLLSIILGGIWLAVSIWFAIWWAQDVSHFLPAIYVWCVIIGIALLPGFLMGAMFFSNILHSKVKKHEDVSEPTTVIMCAHNEEANISEAICCMCQQIYAGDIRLLVVDNRSTDSTKQCIESAITFGTEKCSVEYVYCKKIGKQKALNHALRRVKTKYFITVDADTYLERHAVQHIMNHIVHEKSACVAGNLFVKNAKSTLVAKMQNYDYLLSIAAIKRFQGSYKSTLVAQGAFSAYETKEVKALGGWKNCLGEDIVLTYQILKQGKASTYEPKAVGYTTVPHTLDGLYNQRKRWAIGMLEGFAHVKPWEQETGYSKYFTWVNTSIVYLDLAYLFGFIPGLFFALFGYYYFIGCLTVLALLVSMLLYFSMYRYQQKLNIPFQNSIIGFVCFLLFFQLIQSTAALHGYFICLFNGKGEWK